MEKIVYVIPGHGESTKKPAYRKTIAIFKKKGFTPVEFNPKWKTRTMTQYVKDFMKLHKKHAGNEIYLFGFSFGAIISMIAATKIKPSAIILCSLSPFFKEDLREAKGVYGKKVFKYFTKRQLTDLNKYSFDKIAPKIACRTTVFVGEKETPHLIRRTNSCRKIRKCRIMRIKEAKHQFTKEYLAAIEKTINKL